ncbi:MAG: glutathione S-transferase N-terminal domain-containing protein [Anaerolineae bacterium]|nr:glutathione S-transferase N-terminal domain-containing protein [Anaerolineae bacterium]
MSDTTITVYGTAWCPDVRRARRFLDQNGVAYDFVDIDKDAAAAVFVEQTNRGHRSVPTILFPDGSTLTEPSTHELRHKLGL